MKLSCFPLKTIIDLHCFLLQVFDSEGFPLQSAPPWAGTGEEQLLTLSAVPSPQVREHGDQICQAPQEPSTEPTTK